MTVKCQQWQVGVGVAYCVTPLFNPYAAIKWSHVTFDLGNPLLGTVLVPNFDGKKYFGYAIGVSFLNCQCMSLTVESRFLNEKALYINGQICF